MNEAATPTTISLPALSVSLQPHAHAITGRESCPRPDLTREPGRGAVILYPSPHMNEDAVRDQDHLVAHVTITETADISVTVEDLGGDAKNKNDDAASVNSEEEEEDLRGSETLPRPSCRVTFRPRVRITSGFSRGRQTSSYHQSQDDPSYHILTATSSRSCSPSGSSSISAPLRFHSEERGPKPGWGTLGQRVSLLARRGEHKRRFRERLKQHERMLKAFQGDPYPNRPTHRRDSETSPLLRPRLQQYVCQCGIVGCEYDENRISQEIDLIFGTWPHRLFNPKWWWWHVQPIVFCRCLDDPEDEY
ncbi:hypothetical protein D9611_003384 [Ephemerocybe angulata]|uniref:Uncharacterized protein n=1 Tax=Ephemerocybe angulata TaxID=980116 RepID=A0A8H5FHL4_9AGAR|nr:hypothetical protein D9611_003384 [Tulosesus angulatus]